MKSSCTKTDSGVTIDTIIRFIACDTDSCLGMWFIAADSVESFLVTVGCKEARGPISDFHEVRPSDVTRYWPSAISEYSEMACLYMVMNLILWPIFIPRQILEKGVFQ